LKDNKEEMSEPDRQWYLLPIFLGLIGGLIVYAEYQGKDAEKAASGFWIGLVTTVIVALALWVTNSMRTY
jgi:hypothetical protein